MKLLYKITNWVCLICIMFNFGIMYMDYENHMHSTFYPELAIWICLAGFIFGKYSLWKLR